MAYNGEESFSRHIYQQAPLVGAMLDYMERRSASFHVPGHKDGEMYRRMADEWPYPGNELLRSMASLLAMDTTEVEGTDDLHHPTGPIAEAQRLAARCFGAEETHFLIGGSTVGNMGLLLSSCTRPGDLIIVQRNVHKSILHGLMLVGAMAVFLTPRTDPVSGLAAVPGVETVSEALNRYPQAKAVMITNPNYYGIGTDISEMARLVHDHGIPLLVDEAHGAHFGFHPSVPPSALSMGADGVVQSTHKMLGGMTMSAMLHVQGPRLDRNRLKQGLTMLQSSSPSYPLMASLDLSRYWLDRHGAAALELGLEAARWLRERIQAIPAFQLIEEPGSLTAYHYQDPFKIVLRDRYDRLSGYELLDKLSAHGCVAEMADPRYVVAALSLSTSMVDAERLAQALEVLAMTIGDAPTYNTMQENDMIENTAGASCSEPVPFSMYDAPQEKTVRVPASAAVGGIAAETVTPYPPGIPLLYRGERVTEAVVRQLERLAGAGGKCHGAGDPTLQTIQIFANEINGAEEETQYE
ncbi:aminotransferase class I/II-fold pyridoxal phosphate-dependent enzyme [Paenibacillus popilliae]|uniref:Arginine/lysine/ornithine decarboxylase n=1 Tax=Paenibacillus popilliae ATCC 14706 TaxID=1212764 RepID=M9LHQ0_PAEPP|nr:aminotransferase class I/II-fold pyridoxal phosphate-dependent enzyme [Paenibacillus popilliae]GAC42425.1 arginine/lysine/ornithine decarboxylase [Paenibacillus popilliae ATCC 14706]